MNFSQTAADPGRGSRVHRPMRIEEKNKRSCIGLLILLAILAGVIAWMSLGGVPAETTADDHAGPIDAVPPPPGKQAPPGTTQQTPPAAP